MLDRTLLQQALQRAAILSNEKFRGVRWVLTENSLRIVSSNTEQEEAEEELEIQYSDEALDVGFNVSYLLDVLANISAAHVECALGDANSSMLITLPDNQNFKYVVMPMRI
jgi:DNA polymerase-3 subunit beta